jgi:uncharacterized membrane protein
MTKMGTSAAGVPGDTFRENYGMTLTTQPFAHMKELDILKTAGKPAGGCNVSEPERIGSAIAGIALAAFGLSRRSMEGALLGVLGGLLVYRGVSGRCPMYEKLGIDTARHEKEGGVPGNKGIKVERTIRVNRPAAELYNYWRQLENLPLFMTHLESVEQRSGNLSHWVVKGPAGSRVEWDAEVINEEPGRMISWKSLSGAQVENAGSVWFESAGDGTATDVKVSLLYHPPAGALGAAVAKVFGEAPDQQLAEDLERFKEIVEGNTHLAGSAAVM